MEEKKKKTVKKETKEKKPGKQAEKTEEKGKKKSVKKPKTAEKPITPRLLERWRKEILPALMKHFGYKSPMEVPELDKIVVNVGVGEAVQDQKILDTVLSEIAIIAGQQPVITKAKKSISNFKLREGVPIGIKVTLRRARMYEFLDRFISIAVPRIRDFRGLSDKSFDGRGNYTVGLKEQIIFPEIDVDKVSRIYGMDITLVTTAKTDEEAYELLKGFGMPFVHREEIVNKTDAA